MEIFLLILRFDIVSLFDDSALRNEFDRARTTNFQAFFKRLASRPATIFGDFIPVRRRTAISLSPRFPVSNAFFRRFSISFSDISKGPPPLVPRFNASSSQLVKACNLDFITKVAANALRNSLPHRAFGFSLVLSFSLSFFFFLLTSSRIIIHRSYHTLLSNRKLYLKLFNNFFLFFNLHFSQNLPRIIISLKTFSK